MTQVKLWQIVSQTANAIIFSDADGNLKTLPAGTSGQVLVAGLDGSPTWADNTALATALSAKTDATNAVATAKAYADAQIAALVDNAPVALNTLNELAVKLNGEDSAINALLLQVDGKAEKTEVVTQVAQAKQDAIQTAQGYTDAAIGNVQNNMNALEAGIRVDMINYATQTAIFHADNAKAEAIGAANTYTDQAISQLSNAASSDATAKADGAKTAAVTEANAYTDSAISNALASTGQTQADAAKDAAIAVSNQKIAQAKAEAEADAKNYTDTKIDNLPGRLLARTTATACFVASSNAVGDPRAGVPLSSFTEVTGANLIPGSMVTPKLVFVNGLAMANDWTSENGTIADTKLKFTGRLLDHAFDGTDNAIMVLCEYTNTSTIYALPEPIYTPPVPMYPIDPIPMP